MKDVQFAIIGFGSIAKTHLLSVSQANLQHRLPYTLSVRSVLSPSSPPTLPNIHAFDTFSEMIMTRPAFIDICTPNQYHRDYVELAAEYQIPVYCEKPLAHTLEDAKQMVELTKIHQIPNAVALMYRFLPAVQLLKEELENGTIGRMIRFKTATYHYSYLNNKKSGVWRTTKESGGGALLDLGVHLVDLVQYIVGDITEVKAHTHTHFKERSEVDEYAQCHVIANSIPGEIEVSRISAEQDSRDIFEVFGEKGSLRVNLKNGYEVDWFDAESGSTKSLFPSNELLESVHFPPLRASLGFFQNAHTASLLAFSNAVITNTPSPIAATFEDAYKAQIVIHNAYLSARPQTV